jgi:hypothetical protein
VQATIAGDITIVAWAVMMLATAAEMRMAEAAMEAVGVDMGIVVAAIAIVDMEAGVGAIAIGVVGTEATSVAAAMTLALLVVAGTGNLEIGAALLAMDIISRRKRRVIGAVRQRRDFLMA